MILVVFGSAAGNEDKLIDAHARHGGQLSLHFLQSRLLHVLANILHLNEEVSHEVDFLIENDELFFDEPNNELV